METRNKSKKNRIKTILIVDDDAEWRDFACTSLSGEYPVQVASNGKEALRIAEETRPDAIILDIMMPGGKDGFSTLISLKTNPATRNIAIIMLSEINTVMNTDFNEQEIGKYLGNAPSAFLEKPVNPDVLLKTVKDILDDR